MYNSGYTEHQSGDIIGSRFQILEPLGSGGFGKTYLAEDLKNPHTPHCVVKHLQLRFSNPTLWANAKERFEREGIVQQRLGNHPQIPQLLAHFEDNQEFYLVQEFIDGQDLNKEINQQLFDEIKIIGLLQDVLGVLATVHQEGIIHRDIKPSNLIRRRSDGKIILIDFGAVKEITTLVLDVDNQTIYSQAIGTQGYMPPEQQNGKPVFSSDIFALGRTAIYALTGISPIELEDTQTNKLRNTWKEKQYLSEKLIAIIDKMIQPNLTNRYKSVLEVLEDLKPLLKIGQLVGKNYQLIKYLGGSSSGNTYLAKNITTADQSLCVIKQLKPRKDEPLVMADLARHFAKEVSILQRLGTHPQIPELLDNFQENEEFYLVEEFIEGEDLSKEIQKSKRLSEKKVLDLLYDITGILEFIHSQKILHRNLKPSNLIRRRSDGKIVLIDFGSVKQIINVSASESRGNQPLETDGYLPPEVITGRPVYNSDLYALGMTAIEALTGIKPNQLPTNLQTGEVIWQDQIAVSTDLAKIITKMVKVDLNQRYKSVTKLRSQLSNLKQKKIELSFRRFKIKLLPLLIIILIIPIIQRIYLLYSQTQKAKNLFEEANFLLAEQKCSEALDKYRQVIAIDANYYQALTNQGYAYACLQRYNDMLASCNVAVTINNQSHNSWNCVGEAQMNLQQYELAQQAFQNAIMFQPKEAAYRINLAEAFLVNKQPSKAFDHLERAIILLESQPLTVNIKEELAVAWSHKAWAWRDLKQFELAVENYEKALSYNPNYFPAQLGRGIALRGTQNLTAALTQFDEILTNNNSITAAQRAETLFYKGLGLCQLERQPEGLAAFDEALAIKPDYQAVLKARENCL